jgi:Gpi18-like mannosyltransferase
MNFPDQPIIHFLYWLIDTAGLGSIIVAIAGGGMVTAVALTLNWIRRGSYADESEIYAHPTPSLLHHKQK